MSTTEHQIFTFLVAFGFLMALAILVLLFRVTAPYGRHTRPGWGPLLSARTGWIIMECPGVLMFGACFLSGGPKSVGAWVLALLWELHYVHRTLVFPFRIRERGKRIPLVIVASGVFFNLINGYLNGRYLGVYASAYSLDGLSALRLFGGSFIFVVGFVLNMHADRILLSLRKPGEQGYKIPHGGLYRWVSCPNYLTEIIEWAGWAIAAWSLPALFFLVWTMANLVPRAHAHHRWYRTQFPDYPANRKALVPFVF